MFCRNCGKELDDRAVFCPNCGVATDNYCNANCQPAYNQNMAPATNTIAVVGFILSFFIPLAGLICSIMGYRKVKECGNGKGLSVAGIIISSLIIAFVIFFIISFMAILITYGGPAVT